MQNKSSNGTSFDERLKSLGVAYGSIGENLHFGDNQGKEVILFLIIDDGIPSRLHRKMVFSPQFGVMGASIGFHKTRKLVTAIDYATTIFTFEQAKLFDQWKQTEITNTTV